MWHLKLIVEEKPDYSSQNFVLRVQSEEHEHLKTWANLQALRSARAYLSGSLCTCEDLRMCALTLTSGWTSPCFLVNFKIHSFLTVTITKLMIGLVITKAILKCVLASYSLFFINFFLSGLHVQNTLPNLGKYNKNWSVIFKF